MASNPIKYHGGKSYLAKWLISLMPARDAWHLWREPYFGGGAVTLALDPEGLSEAVNDINFQLTEFWCVVADPLMIHEFVRRVNSTPLSEIEWRRSLGRLSESSPVETDIVDRAVAFFVKYRQSRQGLGKDFATPTRRLRRGMNENVSAWLSAVKGLPTAHERLKRIEIRCMDAVEFIKKYDDREALIYADPPYLHETRHGKVGNKDYEYEMTEDQHCELLECLSEIKGRFMLSGYPSDLYGRYAEKYGWRVEVKKIDNKSSSKKTKGEKLECVWLNY